MSVYNTLEEAVKFCTDNNLTFNSAIIPGTQVVYSVIQSSDPVSSQSSVFPVTLDFMGRYGQNLFDVCLNTYGTLEYYVKMLVDNKYDNTLIPNNNLFIFTPNLVVDVNIFNTVTGKGVYYSTGLSTTTYKVFAEEDDKTIFESEDGSSEFTPED